MTVTPCYQAYPDAHNTGLKVPVDLPPSHGHKSHAEHQFHHQQPKQPFPHSELQRWAGLYHCHIEGMVTKVMLSINFIISSLSSPSHIQSYRDGQACTTVTAKAWTESLWTTPYFFSPVARAAPARTCRVLLTWQTLTFNTASSVKQL